MSIGLSLKVPLFLVRMKLNDERKVLMAASGSGHDGLNLRYGQQVREVEFRRVKQKLQQITTISPTFTASRKRL